MYVALLCAPASTPRKSLHTPMSVRMTSSVRRLEDTAEESLSSTATRGATNGSKRCTHTCEDDIGMRGGEMSGATNGSKCWTSSEHA